MSPLDFVVANIRDPLIVGPTGFLLGLMIQQRLQVGLAKRKERIELVRPIRARLIERRGAQTAGTQMPNVVELDQLTPYLSRRRMRRLRAAIAAHDQEAARQIERDPHSKAPRMVYRDKDKMALAVDAVLAALPRH